MTFTCSLTPPNDTSLGFHSDDQPSWPDIEVLHLLDQVRVLSFLCRADMRFRRLVILDTLGVFDGQFGGREIGDLGLVLIS